MGAIFSLHCRADINMQSLIDLAGSEKATSDKERTREGKYINTRSVLPPTTYPRNEPTTDGVNFNPHKVY